MRKILAGFLAAAMVASIGATMSFAATTNTPASITASIAAASHDVQAETTTTADNSASDTVQGKWSTKITVEKITIPLTGGPTISIDIGKSKTLEAANDSSTTGSGATDPITFDDITVDDTVLASMLNGESYTFSQSISGTTFTGKVSFSGTNVSVKFDQAAKLPSTITGFGAITLSVKASDIASTTTVDAGGAGTTITPVAKPTFKAGTDTFTATVTASASSLGGGGETADVTKEGDFKSLLLRDVVKCTGDGTPIPLTEKGVGVERDLNEQNGVQSGKTIYFMLRDDADCPVQKLNDDTFWKLKITKGENSKLIKKVTDTTKIFKDDLINVNTNAPEPGTGGNTRHRYIKVELNEVFTDDEYKITLDLRLTPENAAINRGFATDGSEIKVKDFSFWMKNIEKEADNDWKVGVGGLMLNPLGNDWNEVTYYDEDGDLAFMKFFADSDVDKFYSKLSTKWEHADYASYFNDQDAYIFDFVGSPKISATSRCDLEIYNPFVNDNGDETIDPSTAVIYQVIDGDLFDVTDSFTYKEGDNGDMAYVTRTRFLGTYIICEKAVEEAVDDSNVPQDLVPDTDVTPDEVTPSGNGGGKAPANTGKYL